ncbi:MAG TPA: phosphatase PAP2 family protein [Thermoleophilaceae bacterium]|nr:phosphatase PAP2 family protein [Thermoleophilaceae bacterium]
MGRAWYWSSRWLPNGWTDALRQLLLFGGAYYVYRIVRGFSDGQANAAYANARDIASLEQSMGLFFEADLQSWLLTNVPWVVDGANWMYVNTHFVITTVFLIWLYLARNASYYWVRNVFMIAMGLALVGYAIYPTAPPRFLSYLGFEDTVAGFVGAEAAGKANVLYNPFAAVPSMHVAFALMIGIPAARIVKPRALRVAWLSYPFIVSFVVVVTANHWWIDAALGALVAAVSAVAATAALARFRPEAWSWRTQTATAEASA